MLRKGGLRGALGLSLLVLAMLLAACGAREGADGAAQTGQRQYGKLIKIRGGSYRAITADELAEMRQSLSLFLVNVHIPYEGEIEGTDAFIPFSEIEKHLDELPADKSSPIVLYCRIGVMSADAAKVMARLGYTGIYDLKGGMNAWKAAGREILVKPG